MKLESWKVFTAKIIFFPHSGPWGHIAETDGRKSNYKFSWKLLDSNKLFQVYLTIQEGANLYDFTRYHMEKFWRPLSYNFDSKKLKYISTIEARNFPFVGVQFHPEKNIFEWATNTVGNIPHNRWNNHQYQQHLKKCQACCLCFLVFCNVFC